MGKPKVLASGAATQRSCRGRSSVPPCRNSTGPEAADDWRKARRDAAVWRSGAKIAPISWPTSSPAGRARELRGDGIGRGDAPVGVDGEQAAVDRARQRVLQQREVIALGLLLTQQPFRGVSRRVRMLARKAIIPKVRLAEADAHADVQIEALVAAERRQRQQQAVVRERGRDRREERALAEEEHGGVDDGQAVEERERALDAAGEIDDAGDEQHVEADLRDRVETQAARVRQEQRRDRGERVGQRHDEHELLHGHVVALAGALQIGRRDDRQEARDDGDAAEQEPLQPAAQLARGVESRIGHGDHPMTDPSLKIGRYMEMTRPPMMMPRNRMTSGSIRVIRLATMLSTSSS